MTSALMFPGFVEPETNYFCLPNNWFDILQRMRAVGDTRWMCSKIKILEYLFRHTWSADHGLTLTELRRGRTYRTRKSDGGTGLDRRTLQSTLDDLCELGIVEKVSGITDQYKLRGYQEEGVQDVAEENSLGFRPPRENFFRVPNVWTQITRDMPSAATILVVEYLIRHGWGYQNPDGCWMTAEELAHGRKTSSGGRYDIGCAYNISSIYKSLSDAIRLKLVVWTDRSAYGISEKLFNLRLAGMHVDNDTGEFLGKLPWESDEEYEEWKALPLAQAGSGEFAHAVLEIAVESRDIAHEVNKIADESIREFATPIREFAGGGREFASTNGEFAEKTGDLTHQKTHPQNTTETTAGGNNFLSAVCSVMSDEGILRGMGIGNPSLRVILGQKIPAETILSYALYALSEPKMFNWRGFFISCLKQKTNIPDEIKLLLKLPINRWGQWSSFELGSDAMAQKINWRAKTVQSNPDLPAFLSACLDSGNGEPEIYQEDDLDLPPEEIPREITVGWQKFFEHKRSQIPASEFETWLRDLKPVQFSKNRLTLAARNLLVIEKAKTYIGYQSSFSPVQGEGALIELDYIIA